MCRRAKRQLSVEKQSKDIYSTLSSTEVSDPLNSIDILEQIEQVKTHEL